MSSKKDIIDFDQILKDLKNSKKATLLVGNGFNLHFGINTDYKSIFEKLKKQDLEYRIFESILTTNESFEKIFLKLRRNGYFIELLRKIPIINEKRILKFNEKKGHNGKLKDFAKAINALSSSRQQKDRLKQIKAAHFFQYFSQIFTLNFDTFIYKALLSQTNEESTSEQPSNKPFTLKIKTKYNPKYSLLKWHQSKILILSNTNKNNNEPIDLGKISDISDNRVKHWILIKFLHTINATIPHHEESKNIIKSLPDVRNKSVSKIETEIRNVRSSIATPFEIKDGFGDQHIWINESNQNIYFLHGAIHIYQDQENKIKKVVSDKLFGTRLSSEIDSNIEKLSCMDIILSPSSESKLIKINQNPYMKNCLENLNTSKSRIIVIYGAKLGKNDDHIWHAINTNDNIETVYISTYKDDLQTVQFRAQKVFNQKTFHFFDSSSI